MHSSAKRETGTTIAATGEAPRERLFPHFFRDHPEQLYACHHLPRRASENSEAVLICNPTGHEYERCHKALRQLAAQLARSGHHAMRFDYYGTGDSAGESSEGTLFRWRKDIGDAIDECKRLSACKRVTLFGVRLGSVLAAQVAAERDDVNGLILFAPVTDPESLFDDWNAAQAEQNKFHGSATTGTVQSEVLGFPISAAFREELESGLNISRPSEAPSRVLILRENNMGAGNSEIADTLAGNGSNVREEVTDAPAIWRREPMEALVPFKLIRRIVNWMKEEQI